ncbi:hypothetical protein MNBD_DELTA03-1613 [hydrothermal vent metagenome]|uniref:Carboxypeptidase regulatory-like domain-containing protein n=1 Tax=hydrothermal vent metagenome TaxID=652676 RepID=A0A3B0VN48_9ZZZZ
MKKIIMFIVAGVWLFAGQSWAGTPGSMKAKMGTIEGHLYVNGKVLPNAIVAFFNKKGGPPPVAGSTRRVPDMVGRADAKGKFSVRLLPGWYYMGALIRARGKGPGPPRKGEKFYFIKNDQGQLRALEVKAKALTQAGRVEGLKPGAFKEFSKFMTVKGQILGPDGKPVAGALILLKGKINASRPQYIAPPSDKDGKFSFKVPPGSYYLMVRKSLLGGRPQAGSLVGTYGKTSPLKANAKTGGIRAGMGVRGGMGTALAVRGKNGAVISGITINMFKIPDPVATRKRFEKQARARKMRNSAGKSKK